MMQVKTNKEVKRKKKMKTIRNTICFDDVLLVPQYSEIVSRYSEEIQLGKTFWNKERTASSELSLPIVAAPMDKVISVDLCMTMKEKGGLSIVHRFGTIQEQVDFIKEYVEKTKYSPIAMNHIGAAIGTRDWSERVDELYNKTGCYIFCIDVAHGFHNNVREVLEGLKEKEYRKSILVIAGNVASAEAYRFLVSWGADIVRVGIGGGCFVPGTKVMTSKGLYRIEDIHEGDEVYTHTRKLQKVLATLCFEKDEEIFSVNGIECTKNHEFLVIDKNTANLENIYELSYWLSTDQLDRQKHFLLKNKKSMDFELVEIKKIEKKHYKGLVYDLTIEEDESYNVEGVIVHNSACSTRKMTGHGVPTLQGVLDCAKIKKKVGGYIMADGGIKTTGDMVKAYAAGADLVMLGKLLASTSDSPGSITMNENGKKCKQYRGMFSYSAQKDLKGEVRGVEGVSGLIPYTGETSQFLDDCSVAIKSGLSYSGSKTIDELQEVSEFVRQTSMGHFESKTHVAETNL